MDQEIHGAFDGDVDGAGTAIDPAVGIEFGVLASAGLVALGAQVADHRVASPARVVTLASCLPPTLRKANVAPGTPTLPFSVCSNT